MEAVFDVRKQSPLSPLKIAWTFVCKILLSSGLVHDSAIVHVSENISGQGDKHPNSMWRQLVFTPVYKT